jgi:tripartite ATP-independent transporter DctP family solute receptor
MYRLFASVALSSVALAASTAFAADPINEHSLKFGYSVQQAHPLGKGADKFVELVSSKSGGKIKIKNYPATQLGSEVQMISATQGGVQEMVGVSSAPLVGIVKEFALFDLPFLFANEREVDAVVDGPVGAQLYDKLAPKGLIGLCFWENGFRHVTNSKRPITKAEDFKGLKIRTMQNPVYVEEFNTLGANSVPMAWPEVYAALETKAIDAQENPFAIISTNKINEVQKYLSVTKHGYSPYAVMVGAKFWDKRNPTERAIFKSACNEARDYQRKVGREEDAKTVAELKARGMLINEVPADAVAQMRQQLKPVTDKYAQQVGEGLIKQVNAEIDKVRTAQK